MSPNSSHRSDESILNQNDRVTYGETRILPQPLEGHAGLWGTFSGLLLKSEICGIKLPHLCYELEMYKAKVTVLPEDTPHVCGRVSCNLKATFLVRELASDGGSGFELSYCDLHWGEYANNGALEIVSLEDPHDRLVR